MEKITTKGTQNYRAPEITKGSCVDPYAADIYSAGVILFLLKTGGRIAFNEGEKLSYIKGEESSIILEEKV